MSSKPKWNVVLPEPESCASDTAGEVLLGDAAQSAGEFDAHLPAELRTLAEQLADDANHISACSTSRDGSGLGQRFESRGNPNRFKFQRLAAAVALIAIGAAGATTAWRPWENRQLVRPDATATAKSDSSASESDATVSKIAATATGLQSSQVVTKPAQKIPSENSTRSAGVQEVGFNPAETAPKNRSETEMLRIQVSAFEQVIRRLQANLNHREQEQAETQKTIDLLHQEVTELRRQLDEHEVAPTVNDN